MKCIAQIYHFYLEHFKKEKKDAKTTRKNKNYVHLKFCIVMSVRGLRKSRRHVVSHHRLRHPWAGLATALATHAQCVPPAAVLHGACVSAPCRWDSCPLSSSG